MVGWRHAALPARRVVGAGVALPPRHPEDEVVPADRRVLRRARGDLVMEAGWVVTEVGRQPWIVHNYMKVEDAATGNTGVWITFVAVVVLYVAVGVTTILVLRGMSRRWRDRAEEATRPTCRTDRSAAARRRVARRGAGAR